MQEKHAPCSRSKKFSNWYQGIIQVDIQEGVKDMVANGVVAANDTIGLAQRIVVEARDAAGDAARNVTVEVVRGLNGEVTSRAILHAQSITGRVRHGGAWEPHPHNRWVGGTGKTTERDTQILTPWKKVTSAYELAVNPIDRCMNPVVPLFASAGIFGPWSERRT